jgi:hypothetical protein
MAKGSKVLGRFTALSLALLVASAACIVVAAPAADRGGSGYVEMPARVQTEGLTVEQHLQWQEEMSRRLLQEVPKSAFGSPARVCYRRTISQPSRRRRARRPRSRSVSSSR